MNKALNQDDHDLYLKDQFNIQHDFYQQNNNILNTGAVASSNNNYIFKPELNPNDISTINYDTMQYNSNCNYYNYNDPLQPHQQQQQQNQQHTFHDQTSFLTNNDQQFHQISIDMLFDKNISLMIKCLHKAYIEFKFEILTALQEHQQQQFMNQNAALHNNNNIVQNYDYDTEAVIDMFRIYAIKFIKFVENIPGEVFLYLFPPFVVYLFFS